MALTIAVVAFFAGAGLMAYLRDRDELKRYWEEHDRKRGEAAGATNGGREVR